MVSTSQFFFLIFLGVGLQSCKPVVGANFNDEQTFRQNVNNLLERLAAQMSNIPTKVDLDAKIGAIEARLENLERLLKSSLKEGNNSRRRRSIDIIDFDKDNQAVKLASEERQAAFNESCKFVEQILSVQRIQVAALEEISNTNSIMSQGVGTILTEFESLKYYINASYPDLYMEPTKFCGDDSNLTDSAFRDQKVICEKEWIVIQRRGTATPPGKERTNFARIWEVYEKGFGTLDGDFWLGLKTIHELTVEGYTQLRVDLEDWNGEKKYAMYDIFKVAGSSEKYKLTVAGYTGTAGNSLSYNDGKYFSTYDKDNDTSPRNCAGIHRYGWWHGQCSQIYLYSRYRNSSSVEKREVGVIWKEWKGDNYSLKKVEIKVRKPPRLI